MSDIKGLDDILVYLDSIPREANIMMTYNSEVDYRPSLSAFGNIHAQEAIQFLKNHIRDDGRHKIMACLTKNDGQCLITVESVSSDMTPQNYSIKRIELEYCMNSHI